MTPPEEFNYTRDIMIEGNIDYPQEFLMEFEEDVQNMLDHILRPKFSSEEYGFFLQFTLNAIHDHFTQGEVVSEYSYQDIENIGLAYDRYVVFHMLDGNDIIYDIGAIISTPDTDSDVIEGLIGNNFEVGNGFYRNISIEGLYRENQERFMHTWSNFDDHISAMNAIFRANTESRRRERFLDDSDIFDASGTMRLDITNPDLIEELNGQTIYQIQQSARIEYRELLQMSQEYPMDMLPLSLQNAIYESIEVYTQMIMGVGNEYEGGATLFDKSRSEVELGIALGVERFHSPEEVIENWISIRSRINANNFQDTTVETLAYPLYIKTLNRFSYQKMIDLGATREDFLRFAEIISGRDNVNGGREWNYGPNHYDAEFANIILSTLVGIPNQENYNHQNSREEETQEELSLIEKLIQSGEMRDISDEAVLHQNNLESLYNEAQKVITGLNSGEVEFPQYLNIYFCGEERDVSEILTGEYENLSLEDKLIVSSIARFISYLKESVGQYDTEEHYQDRLRQNAQYISNDFSRRSTGAMGVQTDYLRFDEERDTYVIGVNPFSRGMVYIQVPLENIQSFSTAYHYINALSNIVLEQQLIPTRDSGRYESQENTGEYISWESLIEQIPPYQYGIESNDIISVFSPEMLPEGYIDNLRIRSISESFEHVSHQIMSRFDWGGGDGRIEPQDLNPEVFSQTDRNILELWTDINGLGELFEVSDGNREILMQGAKIALILALTTVASTLTMGVAAGGLAMMGIRGVQFASAANRANLIRRGIQNTRAANAMIQGRIMYGAVMGLYAAPVSWVVYPHGYSSREEMYIDLLSDLGISTLTGAMGGSLRPGTFSTITDFTVLGLMTEAARMHLISETYHPGENFLNQNEIIN